MSVNLKTYTPEVVAVEDRQNWSSWLLWFRHWFVVTTFDTAFFKFDEIFVESMMH